MTLPSSSSNRVLPIYLALAEYPILETSIRARMRRELFERGVITPKNFEAQVRRRAIRSQKREGVTDPLWDETGEIWVTRLTRLRRHLTDSYFAHNLRYELFEQIVRDVLAERLPCVEDILISFNPELAPQEMIFEQAQAIEKLPPEERARYKHRQNELTVVLIRRMISDQLAYINIAKKWFSASDLFEIQRRKIGYGKVGGKAAGMLLADCILREVADDDIRGCLKIPESYFLGSDLMYEFMSYNDLLHWNDQKYKSDEQIHAEYSQIQADYANGEFPPDIVEKLQELLEKIGPQPLIVRSSSLLEDNFGASFAGKYESVFCPNQGRPDENLHALTKAIAKVYASILNPDALLYRRAKKLLDYDERLAILIQIVEGERFGKYYYPHAAGVGFSRNIYRWSPQIRGEDGFLRLVWGLGTRAVDRVGSDYPRLVALSHPMLRPKATHKLIRRYSHQYIDLINLENNRFETLPVHQVLDRHDPLIRYLAQIDRGGYLAPIRSTIIEGGIEQVVPTLEGLLSRTPLAERMKTILNLLEEQYQAPVDMEFVIYITDPSSPHPDVKISLLQCRPQSHIEEEDAHLPDNLRPEDIIFSTCRMVPQGHVKEIQYVLFVTPEGYHTLPTPAARFKLSRAIGRLNSILADKTFICIGPGRWGTTSPDLGVHIGYADIYNTRALIELTGQGIGTEPEPSFGTHFFQDLVEARIFPLAIFLDDEDATFERDFFYNTPNRLGELAPGEVDMQDCLRLIEVASFRPGHHLELVMDSDKGQAVAYLRSDA
ncbi:MAG: PEP/pyruvate-binding domain-containing protein [Chloroflexi bacterium]|nr:PEP/pyruvate-binding domain-containing protein [Chloroflexota bacterium]